MASTVWFRRKAEEHSTDFPAYTADEASVFRYKPETRGAYNIYASTLQTKEEVDMFRELPAVLLVPWATPLALCTVEPAFCTRYTRGFGGWPCLCIHCYSPRRSGAYRSPLACLRSIYKHNTGDEGKKGEGKRHCFGWH